LLDSLLQESYWFLVRMSGVDGDTCNSCLLPYNSKDRLPKILSCHHTYCRACLQQYMFRDRKITCLSCSKITEAESVASLPENPYLRPAPSTEEEVSSPTLMMTMTPPALRPPARRMEEQPRATMSRASRTW